MLSCRKTELLQWACDGKMSTLYDRVLEASATAEKQAQTELDNFYNYTIGNIEREIVNAASR